MNKIIAISGNEGVGKDTVASIIQYLIDSHAGFHYPLKSYFYRNDEPSLTNWEIKKFAGNVNKCFKIITGINFHKQDRARKDILRKLFINFAEGNKKIFNNKIWVNSLFNDYTQDKKWIISDLRFNIELYRLQELNTLFIKIVKNKEELNNELKNFNKWDLILSNDGTIEDLIPLIEKFLLKKGII